MTVSTISSLATGITRQLNSNRSIADSVRSLVSGENKTLSTGDMAKLSTAAMLQNQSASIRAASQNLAAASSLLDVADGGAAQVGRALDRMRDLATRARDTGLSSSQRTALDAEFQSLRKEIDRVARSTKFNGQVLFDGGLKHGAEKVGGTSLNLKAIDLTDKALFGDSDPNLLSAQSAGAAAGAVANGQRAVIAQRTDFASLAAGFDYAAATIESALQNIEASRSSMSDIELIAEATGNQSLLTQSQTTTALLAQTNKLPAGILGLLGE